MSMLNKAKGFFFPSDDSEGHNGHSSNNDYYSQNYDNSQHDYPMNTVANISTIHPRSFNDVEAIGEVFRDGVTTIVNVTNMSDADARRVVDFITGLAFALRSRLERVDPKIFMLVPQNVGVIDSNTSDQNSSDTSFLNY